MSVHVISWVLQHSEETLGRRLVLLVIADHAKEDGSNSWASVATIARETRLSRSQVQRCLRGLEESGAIVETGRSPNGTHEYHVQMGGPQIAAGAASASEGGRIVQPEPSVEQPSSTTSLRSVAPPHVPTTYSAQGLVADYCDWSRALGATPPDRVKGQIAREVKNLIEEGQPAEAIRAGLRILVDRALGPSLLPSCVQQAQLEAGGAGGPRQRGVSADDILRGGRAAG